ncbi:MAG TPA: flagellar basal body L-ring protein FlgH [Acidobacteriaceae bacterium]|nr:flagellar basal body L-ring protein FlgH [Acidobacteriaceae bacterium]
MNAHLSSRAISSATGFLLVAVLAFPVAWGKEKKDYPIKPNPASEDLAAYIAQVRKMYPGGASDGSIWSATGRLTSLSNDVKALNPHDLISIIISENLSASTGGTVKNSRSSSAISQLSALFGTFSASSAANNAVNQNASSTLNAQGQSVTDSSLNTTIGGEVVDVLPNGILVIEAARQLEFNQQTETIVMRGLVRPQDVSPGNQVMSTAISGLQVQVVGKGIVNDSTYRANPVVRLLQRILIP